MHTYMFHWRTFMVYPLTFGRCLAIFWRETRANNNLYGCVRSFKGLAGSASNPPNSMGCHGNMNTSGF